MTALPVQSRETHRIECGQIWGGIQTVDLNVCTSGIEASIYSRAHGGEIGGDILFLSVCSSDLLTRIAIADVRGHGAEVGHISSWVYESLRDRMNTLDGAGVLSDLNTLLRRHGFHAMTTAVVAAYYRANGRLYFSYAGHAPMLFRRRGAQLWEPLSLRSVRPASNAVLGVLPDARFDQESIPVVEGDRLFLYTDGVVECTNAADEEFGEDRLIETLGACEGDLATVKSSVVSAVRKHAGAAPPSDDVTLMAVQIR